MDNSWHTKTCQGQMGSFSSPIHLSSSLNQFDMSSGQFEIGPGQFGLPYVQHEVCVTERTFRQEALGLNLLNFGLEGPSIQSVRADVGNSLLALVPSPPHQVCSSYQPSPNPGPTLASSIPKTSTTGSVSSAGVGSWPVDISNMSVGNRISSGGCGQGSDSSLNFLGREINLSMFGREVNMSQCSRMAAGQEWFESSLMRSSGGEAMKQTGFYDIGNERMGHGPFPEWTEIVSRGQRVQSTQIPCMFPLSGFYSRAADPSCDVGISSLPPLATFTVRGGRVVCSNFDTGQRIGGDLCFTQLGLLGVICSCHGSHMSVAKFTEHVGLFSTNPGNSVMMDGSGESLIQWRRMFFSPYGVKIPEDNQGWDWTEEDAQDSWPPHYKAVVTQSSQKEVDVSYSCEPILKSRVTEFWDASLSPVTATNFPSSQSLTNMGLPSYLGEGPLQDSREDSRKSFGRAIRGDSIGFESCLPAMESLPECMGRSRGLVDKHSVRNQIQLGVSQSNEFFNSRIGSQQFVTTHTGQHVAAEHPQMVGSSKRSPLKELDRTWDDGREPCLQEKDDTLSSFELRLGQPFEQPGPLQASLSSSLATQMQRVVQRMLESRRQNNVVSANSCGFPILSGQQCSSKECWLNPNVQNFVRMNCTEPNHHNSLRVDPTSDAGVEGNCSYLLDDSAVKGMEEISECTPENLKGRETLLIRDASLLPEAGIQRWPGAICMGRTFNSGNGVLMNCEHLSKHWDMEAQHQFVSRLQSLPQHWQNLDPILDRGWMSKTYASQEETMELTSVSEEREDQACSGKNRVPTAGDSAPVCEETRGQYCPSGDMDVSKGVKPGPGWDCLNCDKAPVVNLMGRRISKLEEYPDFGMKEGVADRNHVVPVGQMMIGDAGHGPMTFDSISPSVPCMRLFQTPSTQGCSCAGGCTDHPLIKGSRVMSMVGSSPTLVSAVETGVDKRCNNLGPRMGKCGSGDCNETLRCNIVGQRMAKCSSRDCNEACKWKQLGGSFVPGSETVVDATCDDMFPPRLQLEDLLADTVAKAYATITISSSVSDKQPVSNNFSKSLENNMLTGFSDVAKELVSSHKDSPGREIVDGGSGIGKCSSSYIVGMGLTSNFSSKDEDKEKDKSPLSQCCPSSNNAEGYIGANPGTMSRMAYNVMEPTGHVEEHISVNIGKVEKRLRRTMKYKRLDASIGVAVSKRQKLSETVNAWEGIHDLPRPVQEPNSSNCMRNKKNVVELIPCTLGKPGALRAQKIIVTGIPLLAEQANDINDFETKERFLKKGETCASSVPQDVNRQKMKCCGHLEVMKENPDVTSIARSRTHMMVTLNNCSIKESGSTRCSSGQSGNLSTMPFSRPLPTANLEPVTSGPVPLGRSRPSHRNVRRMVSVNAIMRKPVVVTLAVPRDASASGSGCSMDGLKASTSHVEFECSHMDDLKSSSLKGELKVSHLPDGLESSPLHSGWKASFRESLKDFTLKNGLKLNSPKRNVRKRSWKLEVLKTTMKVSSPDEACKTFSRKDRLKTSSPHDGLIVSSPVDGSKLQTPYLKDSSKESLVKRSLEAPPDGFKLPCLSEGLAPTFGTKGCATPKVNLQMLVCTNGLQETSIKGGDRVSSQNKCFKLPASKDAFKASLSKKGSKSTARNELKPSLSEYVCNATYFANECTATVSKDRLKTLTYVRDLLASDTLKTPASQDGPKTLAYKEGFKSPATMTSLNAPSQVKMESKGLKNPESDVSVAILQMKKIKCYSPAMKTLEESSFQRKPSMNEVRKVRSICELTADRNQNGLGLGVSEFCDKIISSSEVLNHNRCGMMVRQSGLDFSVPVHFTDSKRFVPRGEKSPRGNLGKAKNTFLQEGSGGHKQGSRSAETVEIIVRTSLEKNVSLKAGILTTTKEGPSTNTILSPVKGILEKKNYSERHSTSQTVESTMRVNKVPDGRYSSNRKPLPLKRIVGDLQVLGSLSSFKKPKLVESSGIVEPRSEIWKVRCPLPRSVSAAPSVLSSNYSPQPELKSIKCQVLETELKSARRKKGCHRPKWSDCRVPEGVVECCVCGSSISEFFNQLVCCGRCPVKVHQACYGVKKIPNSAWLCRTCKADTAHPICVLCGYGGGAMTRAQKAKGFVKGLVKAWQANGIAKERGEVCSPYSMHCHESCVPHAAADHLRSITHVVDDIHEGKGMIGLAGFVSVLSSNSSCTEKPLHEESWIASNSVTSGVADLAAAQWVHMVCALWMPGTRCLNFGTMGVFDVSGVAQARRKLICSVCHQRGGACIQCRVTKCGTPFHAWCAHKKGLLQSETVDDGSDQVGFYGKCLHHGNGGAVLSNKCDFVDNVSEVSRSVVRTSTCARTEGYKGKLSLEQRALSLRKASRNGSIAVSPEQVAAWLRINERKTLKARRFLKSANSDQKAHHREYLRYKQEQHWRRLSVYKSGIHALGLYTGEFISRGEMVVEYIGEVVGLRVADKREADYHSGKQMQYPGACYLFRIDKEWIIDATRKGGIARFVNHSCAPNCVAKVIGVKNQNKVVFFAQQDIYAGEEITYDYQFNFEQEGDKIPCFCGSANCRGTLN